MVMVVSGRRPNNDDGVEFINDQVIWDLIEDAWCRRQDPGLKKDLVDAAAQAADGNGLPDWAVAGFMVNSDPEIDQTLFAAASSAKQRIYGNRMVLFAPLYISNYCVNACTYCGYSSKNPMTRRRLTMNEIAEEVRVLEDMGHKRLALEAGEDPVNCPIDYVLEAIGTIYDTVKDNGMIRRVNVNIAAATVEDYRRLKSAGIGTYILFQETYHRETYRKVHPRGPKSDYYWHTTAMDRAMQGGIDDVGIGVLFGLHDYRYEVIALLQHSRYLDETYGAGPHTISVPRLRPAAGMNLSDYPHLVPDDAFKRIVAILRLAVPYTGIILSTREKPSFRRELLTVGVSQISAASCTGVGGYKKEYSAKSPTGGSHRGQEETGHIEPQKDSVGSGDTIQFAVDDHRSLDEVVCSLLEDGYIPSFCTACYRQGRTGDRFMRLAKTGQIQNVCKPNALMTLQEYLLDFGSEAAQAAGMTLIEREIDTIPDRKIRQTVKDNLDRIKAGERDLYW